MNEAVTDRWSWRDSVRPIRDEHEREAVERLRYRVYVNEMGKPYPNADHRRGRLADPLDDVSLILGAFDGDTLVGTVRSTPCSEALLRSACCATLQFHCWADVDPSALVTCSRLVVEPMMRRTRRASLALMCGMYFFGREEHRSICLCSTATPLVGFFQRFGFRRYGQPFADSDSGRDQVCLALLLEDVAHLQAVESPFAPEAMRRVNASPRRQWLDNFEGTHRGLPIPAPVPAHR